MFGNIIVIVNFDDVNDNVFCFVVGFMGMVKENKFVGIIVVIL